MKSGGLWSILNPISHFYPARPFDGHGLCHIRGTLSHSRETQLNGAQAQLRHSNMTTTLEVSTHAIVNAQTDAVNLLEAQLLPNVPKLKGNQEMTQEESRSAQLINGRGAEI
jgi:hypothetical protein